LKREFLFPAILGVLGFVVAVVLGLREWFPLAVVAASVFVLTTIFDEYWKGTRVVARRNNCNYVKALFLIFQKTPRRYGGYLVHLGVVILFVGIAGNVYQTEHNLHLEKDGVATVSGYELRLNSLSFVRDEQSQGVIADVSLMKAGKLLDKLKPALFMHRNQQKPIAEVALFIRPLKDVYLALSGISRDGKHADLKLTVNPLISFVWLGGIVMILGGLVAIVPSRQRGKIDAEVKMDVDLGRAVLEDFS